MHNHTHATAHNEVCGLQEGIRPDVVNPINLWAATKRGAVFVSPSPVRRASWSSTERQFRKSAMLVGSPGLLERDSHESELQAAIERALDGGDPPAGFVSMTRSLTGIRVTPVSGKSFVAKDSLTLARLIDRDLISRDVLAMLGLGAKPVKLQAPVKPKGSKWARLDGGLGALANCL